MAALQLVLLAAGCAVVPIDRPPAAADLAFTHVTVVDVEDGRLLPDHTVLIAGDRITQVVPTRVARVPAGARVIDAQGQFLIPGLVDMHVHLFNNVSGRPPDVWTFPLFVANGVTGVREMWTQPAAMSSVERWRRGVSRGELLAPRILAAGAAIDGPGGSYPKMTRVGSPEEARRFVRAAVRAGIDFVKVYSLLTPEGHRAVLEEARAAGITVAGHVPLQVDAVAAARTGQRSNEHLSQVREACSTIEARLIEERRLFYASPSAISGESEFLDEQLHRTVDAFDEAECGSAARQLRQAGQWQVPTLQNERRWFLGLPEGLENDPRLSFVPAEEITGWRRRLEGATYGGESLSLQRGWEVTLRVVEVLDQAGAAIMAGTDAGQPFVLPGFALHEELEMLVSAGLTPLRALRAATLEPARYLERTDSLGSVAPGKLADLVLLSDNPLLDIRNTQRISAVVLNGRYLDRQALDALLARAEAAAAAEPAGVGIEQAASPEIPRDAPLVREIGADEVHRLKLPLEAGQFAYVSVVEEDIDLAVLLLDPEGTVLGWYDGGGREPLSAVTLFAATGGDHWLEVHPRDRKPEASGRYRARIERLEPAAATAAGRARQWLSPWAVPGQPGLAVGVSRNGETLLLEGFGTANLEHDVPITGQTVFHAASLSKQVVGFAIQLLVEQGLVALDDDVRTHLPWVPDLGHRITLRHLMHHTHGLPGTLPRLMLAGWRVDDVFLQSHVLDLVRRQSELYFEPGSEFLYTNTGHELLVEVVEAVTGQSFRQWTTENLFAPLGMERSIFRDDPRTVIPDLADGYYVSRDGGIEKFVDSFALLGGLGLHTTAEDFLKWLRNLETGAVGGPAVLRRMHERGRLNSGEDLDYASGLEWETHGGRPTVFHGGGLWPLRSFALRFPEQGLDVVVLGNRAELDRTRLAVRIAEIFLGDPVIGNQPLPDPADPAGLGESRAAPRVPPGLEAYLGRYRHPDFGVDIFRSGTNLYALGPNWISELLVGDQPESMIMASFPHARLVFHRDGERGVTGFTLIEDGEAAGEARRVEPYDPPASELAAYVGAFHSDALRSTWTFAVRDGELVATHRRHDDIVLSPVAPGRFRGPWFMSEVEFLRDPEGRVTEVSFSQERVRDERFVKLGEEESGYR